MLLQAPGQSWLMPQTIQPLIPWPWKVPGDHPGDGVSFHIFNCYWWHEYGNVNYPPCLNTSPEVTSLIVLPNQVLYDFPYIIGKISHLPTSLSVKHITLQVIVKSLKLCINGGCSAAPPTLRKYCPRWWRLCLAYLNLDIELLDNFDFFNYVEIYGYTLTNCDFKAIDLVVGGQTIRYHIGNLNNTKLWDNYCFLITPRNTLV